MVAYTLVAVGVAVYEGGVGDPGGGGLVGEFFALGIVGLDAGCDFGVYGFLDGMGNFKEIGG